MRRLFGVLAAALAVSAADARAQGGADPVEACRTAHAADAASRIACLENAVRALQGALPAPEAPPPLTEPRPSVIDRLAGVIPDAFRAREARAPEEQGPQSLTVRLVSVRYGADGLGVFETADGQVWRETTKTPRRARLDPGEQYDAVVTRGVVGGWRMDVQGVRRELKVEPLN